MYLCRNYLFGTAVAFVEQDVCISEVSPGNTATFFVILVDDNNAGNGLAAELTVYLEFVPFSGLRPASKSVLLCCNSNSTALSVSHNYAV